jgi:tRNA A37 methylthiotransferase MiaB
VPPETIRRRTTRLRQLGARKHLGFRRAQVGRELSALVLEQRDRETGRLVGLTDNYLEVAFPGPDALMRRFARVHVTAPGDARLARMARMARLEGAHVADG